MDLTIDKNNFKIENYSKKSIEELKKDQKSLESEIDNLFDSLNELIKNSKRSLLSKDTQQDKEFLIKISDKLENKINDFFVATYEQEVIDELGQNRLDVESSLRENTGVKNLSEYFSHFRYTSKGNQLFDTISKEEIEKRLQKVMILKKL